MQRKKKVPIEVNHLSVDRVQLMPINCAVVRADTEIAKSDQAGQTVSAHEQCSLYGNDAIIEISVTITVDNSTIAVRSN